MRIRFISLLLVLTLVGCSKDEAQVIVKGSRHFGIHITQAELQNFDEAFDINARMGADIVPVTLNWTTIETNTGWDPNNILAFINGYYPSKNVKVSLCISPIAGVSKDFPDDLKSKKFNDPLVIERFKALIDSLHKYPPAVDYNNIFFGNEVDLYLSGHPEEWSDFIQFYQQVSEHAKSRWGNTLKTGVETTWAAMTGNSKNEIQALNETSDLVAFTYYPLNADFTMQDPGAFVAAIDQVVKLYPARKLFLEETGYASSEVCNSSDEKQRQYIKEVFRGWDKHASQLEFVGFLWLTDLSEAQAQFYVDQYNIDGYPFENSFREYVRTTGLRTWEGKGSDKPAFKELQTQLAARGW
jgi:hypothetical protein